MTARELAEAEKAVGRGFEEKKLILKIPPGPFLFFRIF